MGDRIKLTIQQGSFFLNGAVSGKMLAEVGDKKFTAQVQGKINEKIRLLGKILKKYSTKKNGQYLFGGMENYKTVELDRTAMNGGPGGSVEMVEAQREIIYPMKPENQEIEVEVELTGAAKSGIYWLCYLWTHPGSVQCQNIGFADDVVWPVIDLIGKTGELRKDIGLVDDSDDEYFGDEKPAEAAKPAAETKKFEPALVPAEPAKA